MANPLDLGGKEGSDTPRQGEARAGLGSMIALGSVIGLVVGLLLGGGAVFSIRLLFNASFPLAANGPHQGGGNIGAASLIGIFAVIGAVVGAILGALAFDPLQQGKTRVWSGSVIGLVVGLLLGGGAEFTVLFLFDARLSKGPHQGEGDVGAVLLIGLVAGAVVGAVAGTIIGAVIGWLAPGKIRTRTVSKKD